MNCQVYLQHVGDFRSSVEHDERQPDPMSLTFERNGTPDVKIFGWIGKISRASGIAVAKLPTMKTLRDAFGLFIEAANSWIDDDAPAQGAALAYYTIFSLAPLLLVVIAVAGLVFGQDAARGQIFHTLQGVVGTSGADMIQSMLQSVNKPRSGIIATIVGVLMLLVGASSVFIQLQSSLNLIWKVKKKKGDSGIRGFLLSRLLSVGMILGIGFLLLASLLITAALAATGVYVQDRLPGGAVLWQGVNFAVSFAVVTGLFAMIYKFLPDAKIAWKDVWIGAAVTSALFTLGKWGIGLYLGKASIGSSYGAAGSLVVVLAWIYYSSQIVFFGAEFTKAYSNKFGCRVVSDYDYYEEHARPGLKTGFKFNSEDKSQADTAQKTRKG